MTAKSGKEIKCLYCGNLKYMPPARIKAGASFCSRKCHYLYKRQGVVLVCECGKERYSKPSRDYKYCSKECNYKYNKYLNGPKNPSQEVIERIRAKHKGKRYSKATEIKRGQRISPATEFKKGQLSGDKHHNWNGGITPENVKIRNSDEYKQWRLSVFKRDKFKCVWCGSGKDVQADHIKPFAKFKELRFDIANGRTLCNKCHESTVTYKNGTRNMLKILVTGCSGYLGDAIVENLLSFNHYVYGVDKLLYTDKYSREHELFDFANVDICSDDFYSLLLNVKPDVVIHCAALVGDGACALQPDLTYKVNQEATARLANHCKINDILMIFMSTCSVFGASENELDEDGQTLPLSLYASTKLAAEQFVQEVPRYFIFRLGTLYGLSTEHARIRTDLVANLLTIKAIKNEDITVFNGLQYRPLVHVKDIARIVASSVSRKEYGTYILSKDNITISELASKIKECVASLDTNLNSNIIYTGSTYEDRRNYRVDTTKAFKNGLAAQIDLDFGIKEFAAFLLEGRVANVWAKQFNNAKYLEGIQ